MEKKQQVAIARSQFEGVTSSTIQQLREHFEAHGKNREPMLDGISSDYDMKLFREAQARACEDKVFTRFLLVIFLKHKIK